jgi:hypothetical protein
MKPLRTSLFLLASAVLFLVISVEACPAWLRSLGPAWEGLADAKEELILLQGRRAELEDAFARTQDRREQRLEVLQELLAGRLDLLTAAARFQELDRLPPAIDQALAYQYPRMSAGERACRHLLDWIKENRFGTPPWSACREVHARLEAELEHYLRTQGDVHLPEIAGK